MTAQVSGIESVRFRNYSVGQGLPQASIVAMAQDPTGYLWFGTQDGLARFDGYEFTVFQHARDDPRSIAGNHVQALAVDGDGSLWVGLQTGGLDHYRPDGSHFEHFPFTDGRPGSLAADMIEALAIDRRGRLWIASLAQRLQWIERGSTRVDDAPIGRQSAFVNVHVLLPMADGALLVGSGSGLWRVSADGAHLRPWGDVAGQEVFALATGADGELWVGTARHGLLRLAADGRLLAAYRHDPQRDDSLPDDEVRGLYLDVRGQLWIAGNARGLARLDPATGRFAQFRHRGDDAASVASNRLWCVTADRNGLLLVGSWDNGFSVHDPATEMFTQLSSVVDDPRTLPANPSPAVLGNSDGTLWVGMIAGGGLVRFDPARGVVARYRHDPANSASLANDAVQYLAHGPDGSLWVATSGGGLDHLRSDGGFDHLRHDPQHPGSLASDATRYVYFDSAGTMWVATSDAGLDERCATCTTFRHRGPNSPAGGALADVNIGSILETRDGALWVGTRAAGLYRRARGANNFTHIVAGDGSGLSSNSITSLFEDRHGDLWVGTQGGALNRARGPGHAHFETIDNRQGLASDAIGGILEAPDGSIWVSSINGISRIEPATLVVRNFGAHTGASERGYWVGSRTSLADGRLAFGGLAGVTLVDTTALQPLPVARPVITAVILRGQRIDMDGALPDGATRERGALVLGHRLRDFGAEFTSLEFSAPETVQYAYRLDGHDDDWLETSSNRRAVGYTNLPAGRYLLRVRARHGGAAWSPEVASLAIIVKPAWWLSPWAWLGYALGSLLILALLGLRIRVNLARRAAVAQAIRHNEERLKLSLWGSGSEMWDADLVTGRLYRENRLASIAASVDAGAQTLGSYAPFLHPDDAAPFKRTLAAHLRGQTDAFEASYRTPKEGGGWIWLLSRGRVVERDAAGRALRISGTTTDITALKQAEAALRDANEQLESRVATRTADLGRANVQLQRALDDLTHTQHQLLESEKLASLGSLVAGVAHEINTPLGVSVTAASYLQDEVARWTTRLRVGSVDAAAEHLAQHIGEAADLVLRNLRRADRLVKSFKQVAVDQGGDDVRVVELAHCLADIVTTLGPSLRRRPVTIAVTCPPALRVRTSPGALYQIVTNLVQNSLLHGYPGQAGGHITLAASEVATSVVLVYRDDGAGMTEAVRARVFEPFFTTRRGSGGSGLGMHIVYTLATQVLRGDIQLASAPGRGVTVTVRFADLPETTIAN